MIKVCLVEDQTLVREGIQALLRLATGMKVIAGPRDGEEAIKTVLLQPPDVLLLDMHLPKRNGLEVIQTLGAQRRLPPTLILTTFGDDPMLTECLRAGARGVLLKDVSLEDLTSAIRTIHAGGTMMSPGMTETVKRRVRASPATFSSSVLPEKPTRREAEVLRLLSAGSSNGEIAKTFGVSEGTIKNHVSSILSKLGVRDRTRAVLKAIELGYI